MIVPFYGEFMWHPIPLELSFGKCTHGCRYCFVDANHKGGKPLQCKTNSIVNLIADYRNRETLTARLLQDGYPVTVSNRVDPFCKGLYKRMLPIISLMSMAGIPIYFQTKGGYGIDDVLEYLPPSVWYITIETLDDDVIKRISNAPPASDRLLLIEKLIERGHEIQVGINPYVPEWNCDIARMGEELLSRGVKEIVLQNLHFSSRRAKILEDKDIQALGEDVIKLAISRTGKIRRMMREQEILAYDTLTSMGMLVELPDHYGPTNHSACKRLYNNKVFPMVYDLIDMLRSNQFDESMPFDFECYSMFMAGKLPQWSSTGMRDYIFTSGRFLRNRLKLPAGKLNYKQILVIGYKDDEVKWNLARTYAFAKPAHWEGGGWKYYVDDMGLPYYAYNQFGFEDRCYQFDLGGLEDD